MVKNNNCDKKSIYLRKSKARPLHGRNLVIRCFMSSVFISFLVRGLQECIPICTQDLILTLHSGIIPSGTLGPYEVPGIDPWSAPCKASVLSC